MYAVNMIRNMFLTKYCQLLDTIIRLNYNKINCNCKSTGGIVLELGGSVIDYADESMILNTWNEFLDSIQVYDKSDILLYLKQFEGVKKTIDDNRTVFCRFMCSHLPNSACNPHQLYLDYDDYDETG